MKRPLSAVMLAGTIRRSPLHEALSVHVLSLPVGRQGTLLDAWLEALGSVRGLNDIRAVVNTSSDVEMVESTIGNRPRDGRPSIGLIAEPAAWRGAGGILRDVASDLSDDSIIVVCEAKRLPPQSLQPLVDAFEQRGEEIAGVVGVCGRDEPAGVYAFTRSAIGLIPSIGYFDMKEQFLPALCRSGGRVLTARLCESVWRLGDLDTYLASVRQSLACFSSLILLARWERCCGRYLPLRCGLKGGG